MIGNLKACRVAPCLRRPLWSAVVTVLMLVSPALLAQTFDSDVPDSWTCEGACGSLGADGVVTLAPNAGQRYGYVVTLVDGPQGLALPDVGGDGEATTGSRLRSSAFSADAGQELQFWFNYITSDGGTFADYAWARVLEQASGSEVALLFTARTSPQLPAVPGFAMPAIAASIAPAIVQVVAGGPQWSPLGAFSGGCFLGTGNGCGYTGWVQSSYQFEQSGTYILEFGVVNWNDVDWQSGLAFDGITVDGVDIVAPPPPPTVDVALSSQALSSGFPNSHFLRYRLENLDELAATGLLLEVGVSEPAELVGIYEEALACALLSDQDRRDVVCDLSSLEAWVCELEGNFGACQLESLLPGESASVIIHLLASSFDPSLLNVTLDQLSFTVTASSTPASGGQVSPSGLQQVRLGSQPEFTLVPAAGYEVEAVGGTCGGVLDGSTFTVSPVVQDCSVEIVFRPVDDSGLPQVEAAGAD